MFLTNHERCVRYRDRFYWLEVEAAATPDSPPIMYRCKRLRAWLTAAKRQPFRTGKEGRDTGVAAFAPGREKGSGWILRCDYAGEQEARPDDLFEREPTASQGGRAGAGGGERTD